MKDPITVTVNVQNMLVDEAAVRRLVAALRELGQQHDIHVEWIGRVGHATLTRRTWQTRTYQRRQHPATFAGPDKRSAWRGGRRSTDVHRDRRVLGRARRSSTNRPMFWLHSCLLDGNDLYLHTRFCPNCGLERTTFYDRRRTGASERRRIR